ncbi:MAG: type II secretion system F family protein [Candidatus Eisenbacteria bacterium]|nr:type II secretion system F family protein [Candidatus Eisenbacteria bacterium]
MATFVWKGKSMAGALQSGEAIFDTQDEVVSFLRRKRIAITSIAEKPKDLKISFAVRKKVGTKDLAVFTRQFATMINAGLPLVQCLEILSKQTEKPYFRNIITETMHDVESGATLAGALGKHRKVFDDLFVNMVKAGEEGGILDDILLRLATYIEKAEALKRKVKSAMMYPLVVLVVALGATTFMLLFIIPTFARMFTDFGGQLPIPTRIVLAMSNMLRHYWWALGGGLVGAIVGFRQFYQSASGRMTIDRLQLRVPVLGEVLRKASVARFTRTLGTLVKSGVPILTGLEITANTAGNKVISEAILQTRASIREGETLAAPLKACDIFPAMVVQMIAVGEETGALDEMLRKIADFYDDEVDTAVDTLTSVIEPVMIVVMGVLVGGMVIAMYLPMFKLVTLVAG